MTTQSPHLYSRQDPGQRAAGASRQQATGAETRLPWWALALPALAFAALLGMLSAGSAGASAPAGGTDTLGRLAPVLGALLHHLM